MTREELVALCRKAPDVGQVKHEDFVDYITVIERRKRTPQGWVSEATPYMSVDGRLAMANADHRKQGKKMDFENPVVLVDTPEQLTLMVTIVSEIYGRRHGIATSRRAEGAAMETQHPWEIAETSAMGRALASMGYGLLPGSGLASAEDMIRTALAPQPASPAPNARLSERQRGYLLAAYARKLGGSPEEAQQRLDAICHERYGHSFGECTADEGKQISLWLNQLPARQAGNGTQEAA